MTTHTLTPPIDLTAKQEAFCVYYLSLKHGTNAAIKAGYSPHLITYHSNNLLENVSIKARLAELQAQVRETAGTAVMSKAEIEARLSEIARNGNPKQADPVMAIRELNKMEGHYAPEKHAVIGKVIFEVVHVEKRKDYIEELSDGHRDS